MHLSLVNALLAEKDRLIREKDELVDSKDKLWRELHAIVRAKDAENEALRQAARGLSVENDRIRRKSETLERALKHLVDQEQEDGASVAEDEDEIKVYASSHVFYPQQCLTIFQRRRARSNPRKCFGRCWIRQAFFRLGLRFENIPGLAIPKDGKGLYHEQTSIYICATHTCHGGRRV